MNNNNQNTLLTYILADERGVVSFSPEHSDTLLNATFMEQIVGTLVKYGDLGRFEPYLAESWSTEDNGLTWRFRLRADLACEDGTAITAPTLINQLNTLLALYLKSGELPVFSKMKGYYQFKTGSHKVIEGASALDDKTIIFKFSTPPDGLLEFLSMPYYGFYCPGDFQNGAWKDPNKITSSGAYSVESKSAHQVTLRKREGWFSLSRGAPTRVVGIMEDYDAAVKNPPKNTIIAKRLQPTDLIPSGYERVLGTPTDLVAIALSPQSPAFSSENVRKQFRNTFYLLSQAEPIQSQIDRMTQTFYSDALAASNVREVDHSDQASAPTNSILRAVISNAITSVNRTYLQEIVTRSLEPLGIKIQFEQEDRTQPGWKEKLDNMEGIDMRIVRVDIGGSAENWVVRMMFCSRMGVSFPDPSGKVCRLTELFAPAPKPDQKKDYSRKFEEIIAADAAVIPVYHTSFSWLYSKDIDQSSTSPTMNLPRFDLMNIGE